MYVDKKLKGIKAVQTLSRLNRTHPDKSDTFILDFINTSDEIKESFEPFYKETTLDKSTDPNILYDLLAKLRQYNLYSNLDVEQFVKVYISGVDNGQGRIESKLKSIVARYMEIKEEDRFLYRLNIKNFINSYKYITKLVRMFDIELHKEYLFFSFLIKLLPIGDIGPIEKIDLDGKIDLEYYKLDETFKGEITLEDSEGYKTKSEISPKIIVEEDKELLDEIIKRFNDSYVTDFSDDDRVRIEAISKEIIKDEKLKQFAQNNSLKMYKSGMHDKLFGDIVMKKYMENQEFFENMFKNEEIYNALRNVIAEITYSDFNRMK